jgi:outer membrane biosynthesis protein TonB
LETYKAQGAEVTIEGDVLTLTRKRIGKDDVRRIPLAAVTDVRLKPGSTFTADLLQLVLNDEPPAEMTLLEPNTVAFPNTPKHKKSLAALRARLQAAVEHNRATGGGPVAYDPPRRTLGRRLDEAAARLNREQAEREAQQAEADRQRAEAEQRARNEVIRADLAAAGINRDDVLTVAVAADAIGDDLVFIARMLRPDEPLLRVAQALWDDWVGRAAITGSRLILRATGLFSDQLSEFPLTSIVTVGVERGLLSNELTLHMHGGQTLRLRNVEDIEPFADTLRDAMRQASTPAPVPPAPPAPQPEPAAPEPKPAAPLPEPAAAPQPEPAAPEPKPAAPLPEAAAPEPVPAAQQAAALPPAPAAPQPEAAASQPVPAAPQAAAPQPDILDQIAKLGGLHAAGVLTDEEFQAKKTELLNRL